MKEHEVLQERDGYSLVKQVSPSNVYYCVFHHTKCIINTYSRAEAEQVLQNELAKLQEKRVDKPEPLSPVNPKVKKQVRKK